MILSDTIQLRVDANTKKQAGEIIKKLGLDLSAAIKLYLKQIIIHKGIPFKVRTENGYTSKFEETLLKDESKTRRLYNNGKIKHYSSIKQMHQDILNS